MRDSMRVMSSWLTSCESLPVEQQKEIYFQLIRYGIYGEEPNSNDPMVKMAMNFIVPQIDNMKVSYDKKVEIGKTTGRRKLVSDEVVWELANEGKRAPDISEMLGINVKTIYSSPGWRERKNPNFLNSVLNSENDSETDSEKESEVKTTEYRF